MTSVVGVEEGGKVAVGANVSVTVGISGNTGVAEEVQPTNTINTSPNPPSRYLTQARLFLLLIILPPLPYLQSAYILAP